MYNETHDSKRKSFESSMKLSDYYWANVKQVSGCQCLVWTGPYNDQDKPVGRLDRRAVNPLDLAWIVDGGMASDGPFVSTCKTPGCVAVDHIRMQDDDPIFDENEYGERLEEGFRLMDQCEEDVNYED